MERDSLSRLNEILKKGLTDVWQHLLIHGDDGILDLVNILKEFTPHEQQQILNNFKKGYGNKVYKQQVLTKLREFMYVNGVINSTYEVPDHNVTFKLLPNTFTFKEDDYKCLVFQAVVYVNGSYIGFQAFVELNVDLEGEHTSGTIHSQMVKQVQSKIWAKSLNFCNIEGSFAILDNCDTDVLKYTIDTLAPLTRGPSHHVFLQYSLDEWIKDRNRKTSILQNEIVEKIKLFSVLSKVQECDSKDMIFINKDYTPGLILANRNNHYVITDKSCPEYMRYQLMQRLVK